jgi:class 3 adenylate cyclase
MEAPEIRYVIADDDVRIAYQDVGSGTPLILVPTYWGHAEGNWGVEHLRRLYERLAANLRFLTFDHRGTGMSDGFTEAPALEDRVLDIRGVMDDAGLERANLLGFDFGAQVAIGFAAAHPDRVDRLVLMNSRVGAAAKPAADELHPGAEEPDPLSRVEAALGAVDKVGIEVAESFGRFTPSVLKYPDVLREMPRLQRMAGSRDAYRRQIQSVAGVDVTTLAPDVRTPSLVTHMSGNLLHHVGYARLLAELIPDATLLEFEGSDHLYWFADNWREITDTHIGFVTDAEIRGAAERRFAVVVLTDMVGSTRASLASGDQEWHRKLDTHDRICEQVVSRHDGSILKGTGDGVLATFNAPSQAVEAALECRSSLAESGIRVRAGIHAGEVEVREGDISGAVVNLTARIERAAGDGEIYTSATIRDMLIGSAHVFEPAGSHRLKGFEGDWPLYRVVAPHAP